MIVRENGGGSNAIVGIVAIFVIAAVIALFAWQPWNASPHNSTTIITQPGTNAGNAPGPNAGAGAGNAGGASQGGSTSGADTNK